MFLQNIVDWVNVERLYVHAEKKVTLNELKRKEAELDVENIPPIVVDESNLIVDGVKRFIVLVKLGITEVPIVRKAKWKKVFIGDAAAEPENCLKIAA